MARGHERDVRRAAAIVTMHMSARFGWGAGRLASGVSPFWAVSPRGIIPPGLRLISTYRLGHTARYSMSSLRDGRPSESQLVVGADIPSTEPPTPMGAVRRSGLLAPTSHRSNSGAQSEGLRGDRGFAVTDLVSCFLPHTPKSDAMERRAKTKNQVCHREAQAARHPALQPGRFGSRPQVQRQTR